MSSRRGAGSKDGFRVYASCNVSTVMLELLSWPDTSSFVVIVRPRAPEGLLAPKGEGGGTGRVYIYLSLHCTCTHHSGFQARSKDQEILEEGGGAGPSTLPRRDHE